MRNYQCKKCGTSITSQSRPNAHGCPGGSFHEWTDLGECGNTAYQCRKCGTLIYSKLRPSAHGCPKGSFHEWNQL